MCTPLHIAADSGHYEAVMILLENEADVNAIDRYGYYAIHLASIKGYVPIVEALLDYNTPIDVYIEDTSGSDDWSDSINDWNIEGDTSLHIAVQEDHVELAKMLIRRGASINTFNYNRRTPLHLAVQNQSYDMMRLLLEHGADIYKAAKGGSSVLKCIIADDKANSKSMLEITLQYRGSKRDEYAAFVRAIKHSNMDICEYLSARKNVDINAANKCGNSLLHLAAMESVDINIIKLLIDNGANKHAKNSEGKTPLDLLNKKLCPIKAKSMLA